MKSGKCAGIKVREVADALVDDINKSMDSVHESNRSKKLQWRPLMFSVEVRGVFFVPITISSHLKLLP